jgi:hypothetical protein
MEASTITPLVELPAERFSFKLQETKLTRSHSTMTAGGMNMSNRRINYRRLGGAADLRKIRKKSRKVLKTRRLLVRNYTYRS